MANDSETMHQDVSRPFGSHVLFTMSNVVAVCLMGFLKTRLMDFKLVLTLRRRSGAFVEVLG